MIENSIFSQKNMSKKIFLCLVLFAYQGVLCVLGVSLSEMASSLGDKACVSRNEAFVLVVNGHKIGRHRMLSLKSNFTQFKI